jgi:ribosome biogenesis protein Tsr3
VPLEILILRDPRESAKKCSLTPLRGHARVRFATYRPDRTLDADGHVLLHPQGGELTSADAGRPLLLIDCAWRRVPKLLATVDGNLERRRLPTLTTAYPRRSASFEDPPTGLASVEALYAASVILREADPTLLDGYRWAEEFLAANPHLAVGLG